MCDTKQVALGQVFLRVLQFYLVIIKPKLHYHSPVYHRHQGCTYHRRRVTRSTKSCTVTLKICGYSVQLLFHATLMAPRILRLFPDLWKICGPLTDAIYPYQLTYPLNNRQEKKKKKILKFSQVFTLKPTTPARLSLIVSKIVTLVGTVHWSQVSFSFLYNCCPKHFLLRQMPCESHATSSTHSRKDTRKSLLKVSHTPTLNKFQSILHFTGARFSKTLAYQFSKHFALLKILLADGRKWRSQGANPVPARQNDDEGSSKQPALYACIQNVTSADTISAAASEVWLLRHVRIPLLPSRLFVYVVFIPLPNKCR